MQTKFLNTHQLPFCKGCGHHLIAKNTAIGLEKAGFQPLDVILVTDIGCHGFIDKCFNTHTVHGLHGRSIALGAGISLGLSNPKKKVVVFIGDGGVTIGLQHLLEAARQNIDMCVVIHNNMLYGMTGGQASGLTPCGFKTTITPEGNPLSSYDVCALAYSAGAAYVRRILGVGDFSDELAEAFKIRGFSIVEVIEVCTRYGLKLNPRIDLGRLYGRNRWQRKREVALLKHRKNPPSLLEDAPKTEVEFGNNLKEPISIILGGSAGEGVQRAASFLAQAVMKSGLHVATKGSYPATVGVGFSNAEILISSQQIGYYGINKPDVAIITSKDGLMHNKERIRRMKRGTLFIDSSLKPPETNAKIVSHNFHKIGARNAALYSIFFFVHKSKIIPIEALIKVVKESALGDKIPIEEFLEP